MQKIIISIGGILLVKILANFLKNNNMQIVSIPVHMEE